MCNLFRILHIKFDIPQKEKCGHKTNTFMLVLHSVCSCVFLMHRQILPYKMVLHSNYISRTWDILSWDKNHFSVLIWRYRKVKAMSGLLSSNICMSFMMGVCILLRVLSRLSVNRLPKRLFKRFYSYLIATCFDLSAGHLQANCTNYSKKLLYLQRIRCVLVQI
jgi:hypothetical protein